MAATKSSTESAEIPGLSNRGASKHQDILAAARHVLVAEGYAALTMRRIAREAGLRLSHVQYYFPSPNLIIKAVLEDHLRKAQLRVMSADGNGGASAALAAVLKDQKSKASCRIFWELWALTGRENDFGDLMTDFHAEYARTVALFVKELNPVLENEQVQVRAVLIAALIEGLSLFRGHGRKAPVRNSALDSAIMGAIQAIACAPT